MNNAEFVRDSNIIVSVIAPVYNMEKYIDKFVNSIVNQTYSNIEIILVDDGSTDRTGEILDKYASNDKRINIIHKQNGGVSKARNDGINFSTGDYLYIVDSDDWLELDAIELLLKTAIKSVADIVIADHFLNYENGNEIYIRKFDEEFVTNDPMEITALKKTVLHKSYAPRKKMSKFFSIDAMWDKLVISSLIKDNHILFDSKMKGLFDDGVFNLEIFEYAKTVAYINKSVYHFRQNASSISHKFYPKRVENNQLIFQGISRVIKKSKDKKELIAPFYARVRIYIIALFTRYYVHSENVMTLSEKRREYISIIKTFPYKQALNLVRRNNSSVAECIFFYFAKRSFIITEIITKKYLLYKERNRI